MGALDGIKVLEAEDLRRIERSLQTLVRLNASRRIHAQRSTAAGIYISQPGYALLSRIEDQGPIRLSDLGKLVHMDPATVGRQVRQLEQDGLVVSKTDPRDARVTLVRITPKGREVFVRLRKVGQAHIADVVESWDPADRAQLARLLSRLMDDMMKTRFRHSAEVESA